MRNEEGNMWKTFLPSAALLCGAILPGAEIPRGAHVLLRLTNSVSTKTAKPGDHVYLRTASPLTAAITGLFRFGNSWRPPNPPTP